MPDTRAFVSVTARALGGSRLWGILTLVDGCWKALEENTTVRTVNDYTTVGKTDLEHAQTFITVTMVVVSATFK